MTVAPRKSAAAVRGVDLDASQGFRFGFGFAIGAWIATIFISAVCGLVAFAAMALLGLSLSG